MPDRLVGQKDNRTRELELIDKNCVNCVYIRLDKEGHKRMRLILDLDKIERPLSQWPQIITREHLAGQDDYLLALI